jgi:hypothetical protein
MELVDHDKADPMTLLLPSDPKTGVTTLDTLLTRAKEKRMELTYSR